MRLEILLFHKSKRVWIHSLGTSPCQNQASSIDHICWQVNTERTPDPKSLSSHAHHQIPLRKAYHTSATYLLQAASHTSLRPEDRRRVTYHVLGILGPILSKVAMPKSGMEEPCVGWRPGCYQRRGTSRAIRALRCLLRPTE